MSEALQSMSRACYRGDGGTKLVAWKSLRLAVMVGVVALASMASTARADGIVLESYTGSRPDDATRLLTQYFEMAWIEVDLEGHARQVRDKPVIIVDRVKQMTGDRFDAEIDPSADSMIVCLLNRFREPTPAIGARALRRLWSR